MPRNEIAAIIGVILAVVTAFGWPAAGRAPAARGAQIAAGFLVGFAATWIVLFLAGY
jgi:predicted negative regulator of RcsB-dependent stress response